MATGQFDLVKPAALVVREPTVSLLERIDKAITTPSAQSRIVLTGDSGSGKSAVLLQTVSHCLSAGWVVIYVPKGISAHLQSCKSVIDPLLTEENNN
jgi:small subunit ribosomal protein S29